LIRKGANPLSLLGTGDERPARQKTMSTIAICYVRFASHTARSCTNLEGRLRVVSTPSPARPATPGVL